MDGGEGDEVLSFFGSLELGGFDWLGDLSLARTSLPLAQLGPGLGCTHGMYNISLADSTI